MATERDHLRARLLVREGKQQPTGGGGVGPPAEAKAGWKVEWLQQKLENAELAAADKQGYLEEELTVMAARPARCRCSCSAPPPHPLSV